MSSLALNKLEAAVTNSLDGAQPRSAYIHVPFCRHRCGYCDFAIVTGRDDLVPAYLEAVATELSWLGMPREVDTLYFGGGTPSELDESSLERLCDSALHWHPLAAMHEWTVEVNPESVTPGQVRLLAGRGVTRMSLGAQSFNDAKLFALDRRHTRADVLRAVNVAQSAGLQVCIDLMFAAPAETLDTWRQDVQQAVAANAGHISTYGLTWERGTAFTIERDRGELRQLDEDLELAMYAEAIDALTAAGYEHYEVSNFARPGCRSRHNEAYWAGSEYFAAGPGAARYVGGIRQTNHRSTTTYLKRVLAGDSPVAECEELTPEQRARERLVFGLRRMAGVDRGEFAASTGYTLDELAGTALNKFTAAGLLQNDGNRVCLTRAGLFVSDALWPDLL